MRRQISGFEVAFSHMHNHVSLIFLKSFYQHHASALVHISRRHKTKTATPHLTILEFNEYCAIITQ